MFTGLIETIGTILDVQDEKGDTHMYRKIRIYIPKIMKGIQVGDSISIDGVCQTVVRYNKWKGWADFEAFHVTLQKTTIGTLRIGSKVNIERALLVGQRIGGHFVLGHVQAIAKIIIFRPEGKGRTLCVAIPHESMRYTIHEGSIAIDGISLTIAEVDEEDNTIICNIIDHTYMHTSLQWKSVGGIVNIECDTMAKYAVDTIIRYNNSIDI